MDKKFSFELTSQQIKYKDILNKKFLELEMYAISDIDPNRNKSYITLESMQQALPGMVNVPILGFFNKGDFEEHNGRQVMDMELQKTYWDHETGEQILGLIRESDPVQIVEKDGLHWVYLRCALWVQYCYKQAKRLLKDKNKKVSVEITVHKSSTRDDGIEVIEEFTLNGITILGSKNGKEVIEGIPGAHLSVRQDEDENFQAQKKMLSFAYSQKDEADGVVNIQKDTKEVKPQVENEETIVQAAEGTPVNMSASTDNQPAVSEEGSENAKAISTILADARTEEPGVKDIPEDPATAPQTPPDPSPEDTGVGEENQAALDAAENPVEPKAQPVPVAEVAPLEGEEMCKLKADLEAANAKIDEYIAKIAELTATIESNQQQFCEMQAKCENYAEIKNRMEIAEAKVWEHFCNDMAKYACDKMCDEMMAAEDKCAIETNCKNGKYSSCEEVDRDIAYAVYKARPQVNKKFSAPIFAANSQQIEPESQLSREERIAARNGKNNFNK